LQQQLQEFQPKDDYTGIAAIVSVICFGDLLSDIPIMAPAADINGKKYNRSIQL